MYILLFFSEIISIHFNFIINIYLLYFFLNIIFDIFIYLIFSNLISFNRIDLPPYTSYTKMRQKLLLAISEGTGGFSIE